MVAKTTLSPSLLLDDGPDNRNSMTSGEADARIPKEASSRNHHRYARRARSSAGTCRATQNASQNVRDSVRPNDASLSSSPPRAVAPAPSAAQVRSRFLHRLGFVPPVSGGHRPHWYHRTTASRVANSFPTSEEDDSSSFQVALKDESDPSSPSSSLPRPMSFFPQSSSLTSTTSWDTQTASSDEKDRAVSFASSVTVHPIPKHSAYSNRVRETIWTNPMEMQESAARNCLEFAAENWDWRQVAEDHDMVRYHGEKIHPIHFASEYNIRRQFCAVMSAQNQCLSR
jgi:hypothetical protein